ncbi:MAG: HAD family hydrolase [Phycisphaerales bacterium]|nr:MAG: HAD family hydrolase [Phycisphaerales bacterium]
MIKAVLFDFDQTLVDSADGFRRAEKQAQKKIFEDISVTSWNDFLSVYRYLRKQFHRASNLSRKALWEEVYRHHGRPCDSCVLEKWEDDYWLTVKARTALFPETLSTLRNLARRFKLAVITNTQAQAGGQKHRLTDTPHLTDCFDTVIVAGEAGVPSKPDPGVFLMCLETLSLDPGQAVYVGDDWHTDICGAADAGIQPIWIKHHSLSRSWPQPDREISVPVITSLDSLLDIDSIIS